MAERLCYGCMEPLEGNVCPRCGPGRLRRSRGRGKCGTSSVGEDF